MAVPPLYLQLVLFFMNTMLLLLKKENTSAEVMDED